MHQQQPSLPYPYPYPVETSDRAWLRIQRGTTRSLLSLRRFWWIPLGASLIAIMLGVQRISNEPVQYVSRARLWVSAKINLQESGLYREEFGYFFGTQSELMQSKTIRDRALDGVKVVHPELQACPVDLRITQSPGTTIFILQASGADGEYVRAYLASLIDEFFKFKKELRSSTSESTLNMLYAAVQEREKELKAAQEQQRTYQETNDVVVWQEQGANIGSQLSRLRSQLADLEMELQLFQSLHSTTDTNSLKLMQAASALAPLAARTNSSVAATAGASSDLSAVEQKIRLLRLEQADLGLHLLPKHPKMQALDTSLAQAEKLREFYLEEAAVGRTSRLEALTLGVTTLKAALRAAEGQAREANQRLVEYSSHRENVDRVNRLYTRLLDLLQNVDVNKDLEQETLSIMEPPSAAFSGSGNTRIRLTQAGVAGFVAGLCIVILLGRLDDRLFSLEDVTENFGEEVFGQVPNMSRGRALASGRLEILAVDDPRHGFAESFRSIRSSILFAGQQKERARTILVTSAVPGEGKSTVAANLACVLALAGSKTLLIDCDLRRGTAHESLGVNREPGLADHLLKGGGDPLPVLPTAVSGLFAVPAGKRVTNSGELFLGKGFNDLLQQARVDYDFVILDSPPVFAADDASTLAPPMDGVLFVVRCGHTRTRMARRALDLLHQRKAKVMGVVFNRANFSTRSSYYYNYSGYNFQREQPKAS